jgi:hypothetical protein
MFQQPPTTAPVVPCLFILMEFADGGNLQNLIERRKRLGKHLDEETEIWPFFIDILLGLRHLHHSGIIHRGAHLRYHTCSADRTTLLQTRVAPLNDGLLGCVLQI